MKKYIQRELTYNKSLKLTEETFKEIENLYKELGAEPDYSIWTENDVYCSFDNLEDLLQYNLENSIKKLTISRRNYTEKADLKFEFEIDYGGIFTVYSTICRCYYSTSDENIDILLNEKIRKIYKNSNTNNWIIGKFGLYMCLILFIIIAGLSIGLDIFINGTNTAIPINAKFFLRCIILSVFINLLRKFDTLMCKKLFNPIIYYFGKQKDKYDKIDKIKSNIFWGVIVTIVVGIITTIICNSILK